MSSLTRRTFLAAGSAAAALPLLAGDASASNAAPSSPAGGVPANRPDGVRTGGAQMIPVDDQHSVWVKQVGTGSVPVLTLHGGPGCPHFYLECFEDFLPQGDVRFWYYDQLGCGFSDQPDDPSLWTVDRFRGEVERVRAALGLERFVLYGQSWGGMLAIEYALAYPQHLSGLVISNMTASSAAYQTYATQLRAALPAEVIAVLDRYEATGAYDAPEYQEAMFTSVYTRHLCRLDPWPEPVMRSFKALNTKIYNTMQGPNEFVITGNYKNWDRWADLPRIKTPTLLLAGRHDTMSVADKQRMRSLLPNSRLAVCEQGSHMSMYDDQQAYFAALVPFLAEAHQGRFKA